MKKGNCLLETLVLVLVAGLGWAQKPNTPVTGTGTPGQVAAWVDSKTLGNSSIASDSGGGITVVSTSTDGSAVAGISTAMGNSFGVYGQSNSTAGIGVYGFGQATSGSNYGVIGRTNGTSGIGVWGTSSAGTGYTAGVFGLVNSPTGTAGVFNNDAGGNILIGQSRTLGVFRVDGTGKGFFNGGTQTGGADFAESMAVAGSPHHYGPGDVLVIDRNAQRQLALAQQPYSTLVAGIYSTKPGVLATPHSMADAVLAQEIPLAIVGIVPCKVSAENGPIAVGDLLVTSSAPGYAMRGTDRARMLGAVLGKALEPLPDGQGVVQVLVTLQ